MSTGENTCKPSTQVRRLTRSRLLLGLVVLCLSLWSIKAIHHALQPKYEGKTAEEWFEQYDITGGFPEVTANPVPFQNLGTNAVWFLWHESRRKDSSLTVWLMEKKDRLFKTNRGPARSHEEERQLRATFLIRSLGAAADPLIPAMIAELQSGNPVTVESTVWNLSALHRQPAVVVPALLQSLALTNRNAQQRVNHIQALSALGPDAAAALPDLRRMLTNSTSSSGELFWLNHTILRINGPGPELAHFTNRIHLGNLATSLAAVDELATLGTNARPAVPVLLRLSQSLTNQSESNRVMMMIPYIDPEGIYQKP